VVTNSEHGQLPGSPNAAWLNAKIHTHPERFDEIIIDQVPRLLATLHEKPVYWFIRYRSPHETDHLRLRIRTPNRAHHAASLVAVGAWAQQLRREGMAGRLVFDTYHPETGRYGHGTAMDAAEEVFVADSQAVAAQLRHLPDTVIHRNTLVALNMIATVQCFLGDADRAMRWLTARPAPAATAIDRTVLDQVVGHVGTSMLRNCPAGRKRWGRRGRPALKLWPPTALDCPRTLTLRPCWNRFCTCTPTGRSVSTDIGRQPAVG
jgi:thiopeptide-type bacteriocin biosynthesis protein